jgi:hypothetical protein
MASSYTLWQISLVATRRHVSCINAILSRDLPHARRDNDSDKRCLSDKIKTLYMCNLSEWSQFLNVSQYVRKKSKENRGSISSLNIVFCVWRCNYVPLCGVFLRLKGFREQTDHGTALLFCAPEAKMRCCKGRTVGDYSRRFRER